METTRLCSGQFISEDSADGAKLSLSIPTRGSTLSVMDQFRAMKYRVGSTSQCAYGLIANFLKESGAFGGAELAELTFLGYPVGG